MDRKEISSLEFFCRINADKVIRCGWKNTKYCQQSCKYFKKDINQESGTEKEDYLTKNVHYRS